MFHPINQTLHLGRTCPCGCLLWDISPLLKPPAGTSHLLRQNIKESSVIQPTLATPLIINWNRPNNNRPNLCGQGNKTEYDTLSNPTCRYHRAVGTSSPSHALVTVQTKQRFIHRSLLCRMDASNSRAVLGSSQTSSQPVSAGRSGLFWV